MPEQIFSDHYLICSRHDDVSRTHTPPSSSVSSSPVSSPSGSGTNMNHVTNISGDSDVMIMNESPNLAECPLCGEFYGIDVIAVHAEVCATVMEMSVL